MQVGVPREVKSYEYRVGMVPSGVRALVNAGHKVFVETGAGEGSGIKDEEYIIAGAHILKGAKEVWERADLVVKVKEPVPQEYTYLHKDQILYAFLHLAAAPELTQSLLKSGVKAVAYETIELEDGTLPLLRPMSEVAGRMAPQISAWLLQKSAAGKGKGVLLGGVPGVKPGKVIILGAGAAGLNAAKMAVGMGAKVTILDVSPKRLAYVDDLFGNRVTTLMSNFGTIEREIANADVLVGSVLITGAKAPKLVTRKMVAEMEPGSVIIDISIDQGGCVETARPTSHDNPTYEEMNVIHYCVTNMPGIVSRTSTYALTNVTLPYAFQIAEQGLEKAIRQSGPLAKGVNVWGGQLTHERVADALNLPHSPLL